MRIALVIHVVAGSLGIIFGFVALFAAKGAAVHRKSGTMFVVAMITMALLGAMMAAVRGIGPGANVPVGFMTAYLAFTGFTTVRPPSAGSPWLDLGPMVVVLVVAATLFSFGFVALASPKGTLYGMPSFPFLIFGSVGLLAGVGDLRMIRSGGVRSIRGAPRLARHLWRMSGALLIAALSFPKLVPKPYRSVPLLMIAPLVVLVTMLYWMWRVRTRRSLRGSVRVRPTEVGVNDTSSGALPVRPSYGT